jgi:RNA polymerase sigma-70 factor (ECF subfamily)
VALRQLIGRLAPVDRQLVTLWLEGVTPTEIGEITGMRPGTVAVRLTRIRQSMAEAMQETESHRG